MKKVVILVATIAMVVMAGTRAKSSTPMNDAQVVTKSYSTETSVKEVKSGGAKDRTVTTASPEKIAEKKARKSEKRAGKNGGKKVKPQKGKAKKATK